MPNPLNASTGWRALAAALLALGLVGTAVPALAQTGPSEAELAAEEAAAAAEEAARPSAPAAVPALRRVRFGPSAHLDEGILQAAAAPFIGRPMTQRTLARLLAAVNALYAAEGIGLAEAAIDGIEPGGLVRVGLYEARIGAVRSASPLLRDAQAAWRLGLRPGDPADTRAINDRLLTFSLADDVLVDAQLAQGAAPGTVDLVLDLPGLPARAGLVSLDTYGKRSTGQVRLTLSHRWTSATGALDPLAVSVTLTEGGASLALGYERALSPAGTRLSLSLDAADTRTLTAPVTRTRALGAELGLSHPLVLTETHRLSLIAALTGFSERGSIAGAPFLHQTGAGLRLGLGGLVQHEAGFVSGSATVQATRWRDRFAGTPAQTHRALGVTLAVLQRLGADWAVSVQGAAQVSGSPAPSRGRFAVAGIGAVRGYDPDAGSGDSGWYLRLQLERAEALPLAGGGAALRPFLFADAGRTYARVPGAGHAAGPALVSAGIGAAFQLSPAAGGDILLAVPLRSANPTIAGRPVLQAGFARRF